MEVEEESFLIDPILPSSGITLIHGSTDAGKSTLMFTLQDAIERGVEFFGMRATKARTLYVNLDMPQRLFVQRVRKSSPILQGRVVPYVEAFDVLDAGFKNTVTYSELKRLGAEADLIIFDTLSDVVAGKMSEEGTVLGVYRVFREWFPEKAVVFSHHDRKAKWSMGGGGYADPHDEDALGSGFWRAKAQSALHLFKVNDVVREMKHTKSHGGEKYPTGVKMTLDPTGTRMMPYDTALEGARKWVETETRLKDTPGWGDLKDAERVKAVAEAAGVSERTAWRWRKTLGEAGVTDVR